jgi:O-antigen ligase
MRRAVTAVAAASLLVGPTVLAFFSGGFFAEPRLIAALAVWALVLALTLLGPAPLPRGIPGRLALAGFALLTAWTAISLAWAPLAAPALAAVQRLLLYTGALVLAVGVLRDPRALRAAEPALALGAFVVIAYGLAGRLLPGIVELARSESAGGRLEQPLTYWNAEGALAAIGLVLCARLAGDRTRSRLVRALAAAAAAPLGAGVYLSFSRGAIAVALLGLVVLVAATRSRAQLRGAAIALLAGAAGALCTGSFASVASLAGPLGDRERDGAIALALLAAAAAAGAAFAAREAGAEPAADELPWTRRLAPLVAVVAVGVGVGLVAGGLAERPSAGELSAGAEARRLATVSSNRYEYWRVGVSAFADHPLTGLGAGGFRVRWLQEREIPEAVRDVHSLELEQAAELGLPGLLAFGLLLAGGLMAGRAALGRDAAAAAGPAAATLVWLLHASIDWDWQLPAVTLPAVVLTGALVVISER